MNSTQDASTEPAGKSGKKGSTSRTILEYVVLAVVAIAVALLIQAFLVKPYRIPSESMENTLLIGDRVLVDRISWRFSDPKRGDIVVFHPPFSGPVLIKRIIGMPGDTVSLKDHAVYINGQKLSEPYVRTIRGQPVPSDPFDNGLPWSLQSPYKVPAGDYFVMGDNRTDSGDSREFGPVPRAQLVGRAFARYWPPKRIGGIN
jgi:signal peptidase I